ncbi:hypothetical protein CALCODRAFT_485143 [Calocera cornea HHB12733]|uniref:Aminoglycoside phosphotransferase domain-containing protein n=1 Tax=Calocera cornea HHB12733 TaxID=1353952 RepID=A0A165EJQ1_9BASI|nr:hypothetical protein CALCODRAFT_485143 [Calocera cornea HHB12733]
MTDIKDTDVPGIQKINLDGLQQHLERWSGVKCLHITKWATGRHHIMYRCQFRETGQSGWEHIIIRLCKPYSPDKLRAEISTLRYIRRFVPDIPVVSCPLVNTSPKNGVGCQFSFHPVATGVTAEMMWNVWPLQDKLELVERLAEMMHALFRHRIITEGDYGALYMAAKDHTTTSGFETGPAVTEAMFERSWEPFQRGEEPWEGNARLAVPAGPWKTAGEWLGANVSAQLKYLEEHPEVACRSINKHYAREQRDIEERKDLLRKMLRLSRALPFPPDLPGSTRPALYRPYLKLNDIMARPDNLEITALIDWELTNVVPLWQAAVPPSFLVGKHRTDTGEEVDMQPHYLERFLERMRQLDDDVALEDPQAVGWHDCYMQGVIFRRIKQHCDRQWYELDGETKTTVKQWDALVPVL